MSRTYDLGQVTEPSPVVADCFRISDKRYRKIATCKGLKDGGFCKVSYDASGTGVASTGAVIFNTAGVWNASDLNIITEEFAIYKKANKDGGYDVELYVVASPEGRLYHMRKGVCYNYNNGTITDLNENFTFTADVMNDSKNDVKLEELQNGTVYVSQTAVKVDIDWGYSVKAKSGESITLWANPSIDGVKYRWFKNGVLLVNETKRYLTVLNMTSADSGVYTVAIDYENNVAITSTSVTVEGVANNLALGKSYEYLLSLVSYNGDSGGELTDGNIKYSTSIYDSSFVGIKVSNDSSKPVIDLDLGTVYDISRVSIAIMNAGSSGVGFPQWLEVLVSKDKNNWSELGMWSCADYTTNKPEIAGVTIATINASANGRYIRLVSAPTNYLFMSEISVY